MGPVVSWSTIERGGDEDNFITLFLVTRLIRQIMSQPTDPPLKVIFDRAVNFPQNFRESF